MLAVLNFKNVLRGGLSARLRAYFFPKVIWKQIRSETLDAELVYFEPQLPLDAPKCRKRCLEKTVKLLKIQGCDSFISLDGESADFIEKNGIKKVKGEEYTVFRLADLTKRVAQIAETPLEELTVCVYDYKAADRQKTLFTELTRLCRETRLITPDAADCELMQDELFDETGTACIISDAPEAARSCEIVLSLSDTDRLLKCGNMAFHTVILCADKEYVPRFDHPFTIIDEVGVFLPYDLRDCLPDGMKTGEFAACLYRYYSKSVLLNLEISALYSFGRPVPEKNLAYCIKGIDRY